MVSEFQRIWRDENQFLHAQRSAPRVSRLSSGGDWKELVEFLLNQLF